MTGAAVAVGVAPLFSCFVDFLQIVVGIRKFAGFKIEFFQRAPAAFLMREKNFRLRNVFFLFVGGVVGNGFKFVRQGVVKQADTHDFSPLSISSVYPFFDKKTIVL